MKKYLSFLSFVALLFLSTSTMVAQEKKANINDVEKYAKHQVNELNEVVSLDSKQTDLAFEIFTEVAKNTQEVDNAKFETEKHREVRLDAIKEYKDSKLKSILNEDQYKRFKMSALSK